MKLGDDAEKLVLRLQSKSETVQTNEDDVKKAKEAKTAASKALVKAKDMAKSINGLLPTEEYINQLE
jgi:negative regulator of replication initiation